MNHRALFLAMTPVLSAAAIAGGSELVLPYRHDISSSAVSVRINGADINITCSEDHPPSLEIRHADPEHPRPVDLKFGETDTVFSIIMNPATATPLNAVVELILPPDIPVVVIGTDLRVQRICAPLPENQSSDEPPGPWTDIRSSSFELEGGSVDFRGPGKASFQGMNTDISLSGTLGDYTFVTSDGTITINEHLGNLKLESTDTTVSVQTLGGNLDAQVLECLISLAGVTGKTEFDAGRSSLDISDHNGSLTVSGEQNDITIRRGLFQRLNLSGHNTSTRIIEGSGTATPNLVGGSLDVDQWSGRLTIQARADADLEISAIDGDVVLTLADGASCSLSDVTGHTRGKIEHGDLEVSNLKSIEFVAITSSIVATEIREATAFNLTDGDLTFTATEIKGEPQLHLRGTAWAQIEIPAPCRIQLQGPGKKSANVEVQGCDLRRGATPATHRRKKRWEARRPINLTVNLGPDAELRVDGLLY